MHFLNQYGLFLLEIITIVIALLLSIAGILSIISKNKPAEEKLEIVKLNEKYEDIAEELQSEILGKKAFKVFQKNIKKNRRVAEKSAMKDSHLLEKRRTFVLHFLGDIHATAVENLREEISALLTIATSRDEVVVTIESGGGTVHGYGLGASQLQRIRDKNIRLTVCIDKVAASGGYLMACVADQILAAPFAIIGSIGVVMQMPNFHRLLKKNNIDYETLTSGEYKRTLTLFGEKTDKGRKKCLDELEEIHVIFKQHIATHRHHVNLNEIGTGEHWLAKRALELQLIDGLMTSDDYLMKSCEDNDVFEITYSRKKKLIEKLSESLSMGVSKLGGFL
jgi:serine protease SohB